MTRVDCGTGTQWEQWFYNNNNLMLISRKFTFIYDQMRVTTVEIRITLYE
jgi:hypothetical protein